MPLSMASSGSTSKICKINGKDETRRFLENLGFVIGGAVTVISESGGNLIVNIRDSRIAISKLMATRIMIEPA